MKRILTLVLLLTFYSFYFSQTIKIEWEGKDVIDFGTSKVTVPFFKNNGFHYEEGSVYYRTSQKNEGADRAVTNLTWTKITAKELYDLNQYALPGEDKSEVSYYTNPYTQEKTTNIRVSALKFEKGSIYRLSSFTIGSADKNTRAENLISKIGTSENPLKEGTFYKIKVDKSGIFKITAKFLRDHGINPANVNPQNFRIYGNGGLMLPEHNQDLHYDALQENAIQVVGETDGVWNEDDYALFYAQGPNGYNVYKNGNGSVNRRIETRRDTSGNKY